VVIDEAHNVPQVAREAGTLRTDAAQVGWWYLVLRSLQFFFKSENQPLFSFSLSLSECPFWFFLFAILNSF
jgi:Rad3-related DNA helicase